MRVRGGRELRAGDEPLGRLERTGRLRGGRRLVVDDRRWRLRTTWRGDLEAREEAGGPPVAVAHGPWRRRCRVEWPDGHERTLVRRSWLRREWRLLGPSGEELLLIEGGSWRRGRAELRLRAGAGAGAEGDLPALALFSCAAVISGEEASSAVVAAGA